MLNGLLCRGCDHATEDVLPSCQLSLKDLQLDYLDLYLIHTPFEVSKGASFPFREEEKLMYNAESISHCWEVSLLCKLCHFIVT